MENNESLIHHYKYLWELYTSKSKSSIVSLLLILTYLIWYSVGLVFGGAFSNLISSTTASVSGMIATGTVFIMGGIIIYHSIFRHHPIVILSVISMMGANLAYTFGLFAVPIIDILFDVATVLTMMVLYCFSRKRDCIKKFTGIHNE